MRSGSSKGGTSTKTLPGLSLDALLEALIDTVPHDAELSSKILKALRISGRCAKFSLDVEAPNLHEVIAEAMESRRDEEGQEGLSPKLLKFHELAGQEALRGAALEEKPARDLNPRKVHPTSEEPEKTNEPEWTGGDVEEDPVSADIKASPLRKPDLDWFPPAEHGSIRKRAFLMFEDPALSVLGKVMAGLVFFTVTVSTISFMVESVPELRHRPDDCARRKNAGLPLTVEACEPVSDKSFYIIEALCIGFFTVEYLARMLLVHSTATNRNSLYHTFCYAKEPLNVVDLVAILPFYIDLLASNASYLRGLRLARILRLFKMAKHHPGAAMIMEVIVVSAQPLLLLGFFMTIMVTLFGSLIFFAESQKYSVAPEFTQPSLTSCNSEVPAPFPRGVYVRIGQDMVTDSVTPFRSIPVSLWWVIVTMATVGYGDMSPTTSLGKLLGTLTFYAGIIFLALPIGVLGTNFELVYRRMYPHEEEDRQEEQQVKRASTTTDLEYLANVGGGFIPQWTTLGLRRAIFVLFEVPGASTLGKWLSFGMVATIVVSTCGFIAESMPSFRHVPPACDVIGLSVENCEPRPDEIFERMEVICIAIFTIDYVLRMATVHAASPSDCGFEDQSITSLRQMKQYVLQPLNVVDFLAIIPFYIAKMVPGGGGGFPVLRVLRLIRVFRLLKAPKLRNCAEMFVNVIVDAAPALLTLAFLTSMTCAFFASCIHFAEGSNYSVDAEFLDGYPYGLYVRPTVDGYAMEPSPYRSIVYSCWWFVVTATTVGYGDDYPTTTAGRLIGVVTFLFGIVLLALPVSIVGSSFNKFYPAWVQEFTPENMEPDRLSEEIRQTLDNKKMERDKAVKAVAHHVGLDLDSTANDSPTQPVC